MLRLYLIIVHDSFPPHTNRFNIFILPFVIQYCITYAVEKPSLNEQSSNCIFVWYLIAVQQFISLWLTSMSMHQHFWTHLMYVKWTKDACTKKLCVWRLLIETALPNMETSVNTKFWQVTSLLQLIMKVQNKCVITLTVWFTVCDFNRKHTD
jgi:hypothetical protein